MVERRLALVAATAALAALAAPLSTAEAKKKRPTCKPRHSKTVEVNKAVRVYRISGKRAGNPFARTYACRLKTRRRIRMSSFADDGVYASGSEAYKIQLRGRFVAYGLRHIDDARAKYFPENLLPDDVVRVDVTSKSPRRTLATPGDLSDLALTGRGAVAWLAPGRSVGLADGAGSRTLATGAVQAGSLGISSTFVYWTKAATAFSAKLTY